MTLAATAEVMVAGQRAGLDLRTLLEAVNGGSGQSFASSNRFGRIVEGDPSRPTEATELWTFTRPANGAPSASMLSAVQQA